MKTCYKCKTEKDESAFSKHPKNKDGLQKQCKTCQKEYKDAHYKANKRVYLDRNIETRRKLRAKVDELKKELKCSKCGFAHPAALDFHHQDATDKEFDISTLISCLRSWKTILAEIKKCIVLCSNCHRILHYEERIAER